MIPKFGLNRHDQSSVSAYAKDILRAEKAGWDCAFLPDSPLRIRDNYVLLSAAAQNTSSITIGPLLTNPVIRKPFVTASSISTVAELASEPRPSTVLLEPVVILPPAYLPIHVL